MTMEPGRKYDFGKHPWNLLPWNSVREIVKVLAYGAEKYSEWNWTQVSNSRDRYFAATMRHLTSWWEGEKRDKESGLSHLAHAGCSILFLLWFELLGYYDRQKPSGGSGATKQATKTESARGIAKRHPASGIKD